MSYEFGKMRPPTPVEMAARRVPLETIRVSWLDADDWKVRRSWQGAKAGDGEARDEVYEPSIPELLAYIRSSNIPYDAKIVYHECGSHQLALDWTHLELCAVCLAWREPHGEDDKLHFAMAEAARLTAEHGVPA